ncbi:MAG: hypothetical protein QM765_26085 [Myxococcales bacterium]
MGRHADVTSRAPALIEAARRLGARPELAEAEILLSWSSWRGVGASAGDLPLALQAVRDADASGDDLLSLEARVDLMLLHMLALDREDDAEAAWKDAMAWQVRLGDPPNSALRLALARADLRAERGDVDQAVAMYREALAVAARVPSEREASQSYVHNNLSTLYSQEGRFQEAGVELEAAMKLYASSKLVSGTELALVTTNLAVVRLHQGRLDEALSLVDRSDGFLAPLRTQESYFSLWNDSMRGQILEARGELGAARPALERALAGDKALEPSVRADAKAALARVLAEQGEGERALALAQEAAKLVEGSKDKVVRAVMLLTLAQAQRAMGEKAPALATANEALAACQAEDVVTRSRLEALLADAKK